MVRNVENDYLMCSICLGRYREPRLLPCGHSFCLQCLDDHIKQTVTDPVASHFKCPNDRTEIGRPALGMTPRNWASAFPVDTFLGSLVSAVMIHASSAEGENRDASCSLHKNRIKEFYCLNCGITACAYCVVKSHKGNKCECVGIDEAVDRLRPMCDTMRETLQHQVQYARKLQRGEESGVGQVKSNKDAALTNLTDMETKLTFYYQTALRQIKDIRKTIHEAGKTTMKENAQISAIVCNINDTIKKFDDTCNEGAGLEIMNILPKIESQVREYDNALKTLSTQAPAMDVYFVVNRETERVFENPPALGSVVVQSPGPYTDRYNSTVRRGNSMTSLVPRLSLDLDSARLGTAGLGRSMSHNSFRSDMSTPRTERTPTRPKVTVSVKIADTRNSTWQLTGIAIIGHCLIITDAQNGQVFKFETQQAGAMPEQLSIACPVCVTPGHIDGEALITQPEHSKLTLIEARSAFEIKDEFESEKPYEGIIKLVDGKYAVSCCLAGSQCIDIIDSQASILKTLDKDPAGNSLCSWPRFLSTTTEGDILVSDRDKRALLCMDEEGTVKWTYPTDASPWGVSCHESGSIYLCLDSNEVHVLTEGGQLVDNKYISRRDGVKVPYAIHATGDYIAITEWGSNLFSPRSSRVYMFAT